MRSREISREFSEAKPRGMCFISMRAMLWSYGGHVALTRRRKQDYFHNDPRRDLMRHSDAIIIGEH